MTHGTYTSYTNGACRCDPCKAANRDRQRRRSGQLWYNDLTREQRRVCQVCATPIASHPIRACWRDT